MPLHLNKERVSAQFIYKILHIDCLKRPRSSGRSVDNKTDFVVFSFIRPKVSQRQLFLVSDCCINQQRLRERQISQQLRSFHSFHRISYFISTHSDKVSPTIFIVFPLFLQSYDYVCRSGFLFPLLRSQFRHLICKKKLL